MRDRIKNFARAVVLIWFVVISAFVLIPSYQVLWGAGRTDVTVPPQPPQLPSLKDVDWINPKESASVLKQRLETYKQQVQLYGQRVQAYQSEVNAYTKYLDQRARASSIGPPTQADAYATVVKGTLATLLSTTLTSLLAFAFVSAGAQTLTNYVRTQKGIAPEKLEIL